MHEAESEVRSKERLSVAVIAWRTVHGLIALGFLGSIAHIWWCAISDRRGPLLRPAIGAIALEGVLVAANQGDCPLAALGDRIGDPVPLFELALPPRAAKLAVPVLGAVTATGIALLAIRSRRPNGEIVAARVALRPVARLRSGAATASSCSD